MKRLVVIAVSCMFLFSGTALAVPIDGLVSYYPLDGNAIDASGNGNHGTEYNGVSYVDGVIGQGANFDGVDDYIDAPDGPFPEITVSAFASYGWDYVPPNSHGFRHLSIVDGWRRRENFRIGVSEQDGPVKFFADFHDWDEQKQYLEIRTYSEPIEKDLWYHVAMSYDGDTLKLYVNGVKVSEIATDKAQFTPIGNTGIPDIRLGMGRRDNVYFGTIDQVRIYNRALTEVEIQDLAADEGIGPVSEVDLEGTWDFIYDYYGYPVLLLGVVTLDATGLVSSGTFSTEGESIISGSATFTDTSAGTLSCSITSSAGITTDLTGNMNSGKNEITGTWNNVSDSGFFYMFKRPPAGSRAFSIADLEGTWNFTYYYAGSGTTYSGRVVFDANGILTSGSLITEGYALSSGGATFYDFDAGGLYVSALHEYLGSNVVLQMSGAMDSAKDTITGTWVNWLGYSGTVTLEKQPQPSDDSGGDDDDDDEGLFGCFIATAAYGSSMADDVVALKEFRDNILLKNSVGKSFVRFYYQIPPPLADYIKEHESLKTAVRIGLKPLVAISYSTLHFGPVITLTMLVVLLVIPVFLVPFYRRKASSYRGNN